MQSWAIGVEKNNTRKHDRWGYTALLLFVEACRAANSSRSWNASQSQLPDISAVFQSSRLGPVQLLFEKEAPGIPPFNFESLQTLQYWKNHLSKQLVKIHKRWLHKWSTREDSLLTSGCGSLAASMDLWQEIAELPIDYKGTLQFLQLCGSYPVHVGSRRSSYWHLPSALQIYTCPYLLWTFSHTVLCWLCSFPSKFAFVILFSDHGWTVTSSSCCNSKLQPCLQHCNDVCSLITFDIHSLDHLLHF